jgi:hypothetical protein
MMTQEMDKWVKAHRQSLERGGSGRGRWPAGTVFTEYSRRSFWNLSGFLRFLRRATTENRE